ncbi:MAG: tetratricopeptide repeat protein [Pirellulales bacterium]
MGKYHFHQASPVPIAAVNTPSSGEPAMATTSALLTEVLKEAARKQYHRAIALSTRKGGQELSVINARGVCLMRIGKIDEAVTLFRNLVLQPGCIWMRKDRPAFYKYNFATALLLSGRPAGCLDVLRELGAQDPPTAGVLRAAIKRWESTLPLWNWLDWKLYGSAPSDRPVLIDFEPGDFGCEVILPSAGPGGNQSTPPRNAA